MVVSFHEPCRTLQGLSKMVLANVIAFAVLKILHNLVSMLNFLFANSCWSKQNYKKCPLTFIFIKFSETVNSFVKIRLMLEIKTLLVSEKYVFIENKAA